MSENKSLYGITSDFLELESLLMENEGELTDEIIKALEINENELQTKSTGYISYISKYDNLIAYAKADKQRLDKRIKSFETAKKTLLNSISTAMKIYDKDKLELKLHTLSFRKSTSVEITVNPEELPKKLQKISVTNISKTEIKAMIKNGETFEGINLIETKNLQIK
jgi:hypothetical protein